MAVIVTSDGQVTIPQDIRDRLRIEPGASIDFRIGADGSVRLVKVDRDPGFSRFDGLRGSAGPGPGTDEIMAMTRGEGLPTRWLTRTSSWMSPPMTRSGQIGRSPD